MFKLNDNVLKELVAICDRFKTLKHSSNPPYAFTEHGVTMLSGILNSQKAKEILAHSDIKTTQRYTHPVQQNLKNAVEILDSF